MGKVALVVVLEGQLMVCNLLLGLVDEIFPKITLCSFQPPTKSPCLYQNHTWNFSLNNANCFDISYRVFVNFKQLPPAYCYTRFFTKHFLKLIVDFLLGSQRSWRKLHNKKVITMSNQLEQESVLWAKVKRYYKCFSLAMIH